MPQCCTYSRKCAPCSCKESSIRLVPLSIPLWIVLISGQIGSMNSIQPLSISMFELTQGKNLSDCLLYGTTIGVFLPWIHSHHPVDIILWTCCTRNPCNRKRTIPFRTFQPDLLDTSHCTFATPKLARPASKHLHTCTPNCAHSTYRNCNIKSTCLCSWFLLVHGWMWLRFSNWQGLARNILAYQHPLTLCFMKGGHRIVEACIFMRLQGSTRKDF